MDTSALEGLTPPVDMPPFRGSFGAFPGELDEEAAGAPGELALEEEEEEAYADEDALKLGTNILVYSMTH